MRIIETPDDIAAGLEALIRLDPRLLPVLEVAGSVPLRRHPANFSGLARVVVGQQISIHAAAAIWGRLAAHLGEPLTASAFLAAPPEALRAAGLSAAKVKTLSALAAELDSGALDLTEVGTLPHDAAIARLVKLPGIGPWTAEIFLMFCLGHPDIWPGGDIALQNALGDVFGHATRPGDKLTRDMAEAWRPWRSVAARLFWAYYGARRGDRALDPV